MCVCVCVCVCALVLRADIVINSDPLDDLDELSVTQQLERTLDEETFLSIHGKPTQHFSASLCLQLYRDCQT